MKKASLLLFLCVSIINCGTDVFSLESVVENQYKKCSDKENCLLDLNQAINFDWDNLYCFNEGITNIAVSKAIGFEYLGDKDLSRLILITKDEKIVYEQKQAINYDKPYKIDFYGQQYNYTPSNAKFLVTKDKERNIYLLTPIER